MVSGVGANVVLPDTGSDDHTTTYHYSSPADVWGIQFGLGPKTFTAIHRFQAALRLTRAGTSAAETAAQAHLARDAKRFSGLTFGALLALENGTQGMADATLP